jgi:hypothetical protein
MLLSALFKGATLAEGVETATSGHEDFDLAQTLQGLLALRIITGVTT